MSTYDLIAALPLEVESVDRDVLELAPRPGFTLKRSVIRLGGAGEEGAGEDVTYETEAHDSFPALPLAGAHTLDSLSQLLDGLGLFEYRRWAIESAALDLALRQSGTSLADALGREPRPIRYVVSAATSRLDRLMAVYTSITYKLDASRDWTDELVASLPRDRVETVDFKGVYRGDFGEPPDAALYGRVAEAFPDAWLEDPGLTPETDEALRPHRDRVTWDAAIHSVADVDALPFPPRCLNVKPSRFGTLRRLLDFYDHCAERGIALYGGGQFELGPGRGQIQALASLFHPDAPNDVAPAGFNERELRADLEPSPLEPRLAPTGFGRDS